MMWKQVVVERTSSLGRLPITSRPPTSSPKRILYPQQHAQPSWFSETTVAVVVGAIICVLVLALAFSGRGTVGYGPSSTSQMLGKRGWKDFDAVSVQRLQLQLALKEEEIGILKTQLSRVQASSRKAESNMASQESLIKTLQQRQETEKAAKYRAMYALAERSRALDDCTKQQQQLEEELSACQQNSALTT